MRGMGQAAVVGFVILGLLGCGSSSSSPSSPTSVDTNGGGLSTTISMRGNDDEGFMPTTASAPLGSTVVWVNADDTPHHVVADDGSFDTGVVAPGGKSVPIVMQTDAGGYYHCAIHPTEVGSLVGSGH